MTRRPAGLRAIIAAASAGVLFGIGLAVARMTDPMKVKDFLDLAAIPQGKWDPSLAVVMAAAMLVAFFGLRIDRTMRRPVVAPAFAKRPAKPVDARLVIGAALFGVGWGIAGLCPGPAVANLGTLPFSVLPFVLAMLAGSWLAGAARHFNGGRQVVAAAAE